MSDQPPIKRGTGFWAETLSIAALTLPFSIIFGVFIWDMSVIGYDIAASVLLIVLLLIPIGIIGFAIPFKTSQYLGMSKYGDSGKVTLVCHNCWAQVKLPMTLMTARDHVDMFMKGNDRVGHISWFNSYRGSAVYSDGATNINITFLVSQRKNKDALVYLTFVPLMSIIPKTYALRNEAWETIPEELLQFDAGKKGKRGKKLKPDYLEDH